MSENKKNRRPNLETIPARRPGTGIGTKIELPTIRSGSGVRKPSPKMRRRRRRAKKIARMARRTAK